MSQVTLDQADIDSWAASINTVATALTDEATKLAGYISTLISGQATPLDPAQEQAINASLQSLQSAAASLPVPPEATTQAPVGEPVNTPPSDAGSI